MEQMMTVDLTNCSDTVFTDNSIVICCSGIMPETGICFDIPAAKLQSGSYFSVKKDNVSKWSIIAASEELFARLCISVTSAVFTAVRSVSGRVDVKKSFGPQTYINKGTGMSVIRQSCCLRL